MDTRMVANWIYDENLSVFVETLGYIVGSQFDPVELALIEEGVRESDGDADRWYEYRILGHVCACHMRLALDPGSCVIQVRLDLPELQAAQALVALFMCQCFYLRTEADSSDPP
jgi:hypothetical protein